MEHDDFDEVNVLTVLCSMIDANREFYRTVRFLNGDTRNHIVAAHERNTSSIIALARAHLATHSTMTFNIPLQVTAPAAATNFMDPVQVTPSSAQILAATRPHVQPPANTTCSICQEEVTCATQLIQCGHHFHSQCIGQWFSMNPRCPMCRVDIRDYSGAPPAGEASWNNLLRAVTQVTTNDSSVHTNTE